MARTPFMVQAPPVLPNARPLAQRHASMVSYTMTDLREEINRHRGGEDSRTTRGVVATSRKTLTYMHQCVGAQLHMHRSP
jgi:hypothetical protein